MSSTPPPLPPPRPVIGITMGDPAGIGPEVIVKALADPAVAKLARFVIFGCNTHLAWAAEKARIEPFWYRCGQNSERASWRLVHDIVCLDDPMPGLPGPDDHKPSRAGGSASVRWLDAAILAAQKEVAEGGIEAIVTAPICKASWDLTGFGKYPGHTEFLQARTKSKRAVMMFDSPTLRVVLATVHEPLMGLGNSLSIGRVYDAIDLGHAACRRLGIAKPRIGVCGLNPHAGEGGLFGSEEERVIMPAMQMAKNHGMHVMGPFPADTLFTPKSLPKYDLIVAMYHDQGLIPLKMLAFDTAVNFTLGLPFVRTSPDHGTAFDIAGKNLADAGSMKEAIKLAVKLAGGGGIQS